jgi:hypothetical protein
MADYTRIRETGAFAGADVYARAHERRWNDAVETLQQIPAYVLHQPARRNFERRPVLVSGPGEIFGMDLADLGKKRSRNNLRKKYILVMTDLHSKKSWFEATSAKSGPKVAEAIRKILRRCGKKPRKIHCDFGREFYNKHVARVLKEEGDIEIYSTTTGIKCSGAERIIRTLFGKISRYQTENQTNRFVDQLPHFEDLVNNSYHSAIGMTPNQVTPKTERQVYENLYERWIPPPYKPPKFRIGDSVFAVKPKGAFDKGYTANYDSDPYTVVQVLAAPPQAYMCRRGNVVNFYYEVELVPNRLRG